MPFSPELEKQIKDHKELSNNILRNIRTRGEIKSEYKIISAPLIATQLQDRELRYESYGTWIGSLIGPIIMNPILAGILGGLIANIIMSAVLIFAMGAK